MIDFLRSTVEWRNWGMNALTISALGTFVLTVFQTRSFAKQARAIWNSVKGDSVSVTMFGYLQFYLMSFVLYGIAMKSIAMVVNGLLFICIIPILFGLCKYKKLTLLEKCSVAAFSVLPVAMAVTPYKQQLFFCMLAGLLVALACPAYEIWRNKDAGVFEVQVAVATMCTNIFWAAYAFMVWDVPLMLFNPLSCALMVVTICLWMRYRRSPVCVV